MSRKKEVKKLMQLTKKELIQRLFVQEDEFEYQKKRINEKFVEEINKATKENNNSLAYNNLFDEYEKVKKELQGMKIEKNWLWKRICILERTVASLAITRVKEIIAADMQAFAKKESKTQKFEVRWEEDD